MGPYQLDENVKTVGPGAGSLYLAHHVRTGVRALLLLPHERLPWRSRSPWRVRISGRKEPSSVKLEVDEASEPVPTKEVSAALRLLTQAVAQVEDQTALYHRLLAAPVARRELWRARARGLWRSRWVRAALVGLGVLAVGLGVWL